MDNCRDTLLSNSEGIIRIIRYSDNPQSLYEYGLLEYSRVSYDPLSVEKYSNLPNTDPPRSCREKWKIYSHISWHLYEAHHPKMHLLPVKYFIITADRSSCKAPLYQKGQSIEKYHAREMIYIYICAMYVLSSNTCSISELIFGFEVLRSYIHSPCPKYRSIANCDFHIVVQW